MGRSVNAPPTAESLQRPDAPPDSAASTRKSPVRSPDERNLERAEAKHRAIVRHFRESGYGTAADHLERYLNGTGDTMVIDRDEARSFTPIRNAEQKNDQRFERSFLPDAMNGHAEKLEKLKDGESVLIEDRFAVDYGPGAYALQTMDTSTRDYALAFGRLGLKSNGNFTATRRGDEIHIEGIVDHHFKDPYDFNPGGPYSSDPNLLERHGKAKSFDRRALWSRRVTGTIRMENGRLGDPQFTWQDIDQ
jgi:hypothetical protein